MSTTSGNARSEVIDTIAAVVAALQFGHPARVGVDGRSAAGKTTLADERAVALQARGREVVRASIDDVHRPGHKVRSQRGEWTPQAYYDEGYDYAVFRDLLPRPLGPGGSRRCRTALFDSYQDAWLPEVWQLVGDQAVAVVDGVFLPRPELAAYWDYVIWLDIDMETMVERARRRDVQWAGSEQTVVDRYRRHWIPTHGLYERLTTAPQQAHAVIDHRAPRQPRLFRRSSP